VGRRVELERLDAPLHLRDYRNRVVAELVGDARVCRLAMDLDDDVDAATVAQRDLVARPDRQNRARRERVERLVEHGRALVCRAALGTDSDEEAPGRVDAALAQRRDRGADRGEAALALARAEADPELALVRALHAPRLQRVSHLVAVVERRVAEEQQLLAGALAEARDDVVQAVDLDGRAELLEGGNGNLVREAREPRVERVDAVLAVRHERVGGDERLEPAPEPVDIDIDAHAANDGMISSP